MADTGTPLTLTIPAANSSYATAMDTNLQTINDAWKSITVTQTSVITGALATPLFQVTQTGAGLTISAAGNSYIQNVEADKVFAIGTQSIAIAPHAVTAVNGLVVDVASSALTLTTGQTNGIVLGSALTVNGTINSAVALNIKSTAGVINLKVPGTYNDYLSIVGVDTFGVNLVAYAAGAANGHLYINGPNTYFNGNNLTVGGTTALNVTNINGAVQHTGGADVSFSGDAYSTGAICSLTTQIFYLGSKVINGSFRLKNDGTHLLIDRLEGGSWVNKSTL